MRLSWKRAVGCIPMMTFPALVGCAPELGGADDNEEPIVVVEGAQVPYDSAEGIGQNANAPLSRQTLKGDPPNCSRLPSCLSGISWSNPGNSNCCFSDAKGMVLPTGVDEARFWYYTQSKQCPTFNTTGGCVPWLQADSTWTAGTTFSAWLTKYSIPAQPSGGGQGALDGFRRTGTHVANSGTTYPNMVATYYNSVELGLGRALGCSYFTETGGALGFACYVTNYGETFNDFIGPVPAKYPRTFALEDAIRNRAPKNTVVISYQPSLAATHGAGYGVQFAAFDGEGRMIPQAQLDTLGARPVPQICTECHGGQYDPVKHLVKGARFLPVNPNWVKFADSPGMPARLAADYPNYTKAKQQNIIANINYNTLYIDQRARQYGHGGVLSDAQQNWLQGLYEHVPTFQDSNAQGNGISSGTFVPPTTSTSIAVLSTTDLRSAPIGWRSPVGQDAGHCIAGTVSNGRSCVAKEDLWNFTVGPYCGTCHMALDTSSHAARFNSYDSFSGRLAGPTSSTFWALAKSDIRDKVMPDAQPAVQKFWSACVSNDDTCANYYNSTANRPVGKNNFYIAFLNGSGEWENYWSPKSMLSTIMNFEVDSDDTTRGAVQNSSPDTVGGCVLDTECGGVANGRICYNGNCVDGCGPRSFGGNGSSQTQPTVTCPGEFPGSSATKVAYATSKSRQECLPSSLVDLTTGFDVISGGGGISKSPSTYQCVSCGRLGQRSCGSNKPTTVWPQAGLSQGTGCVEGQLAFVNNVGNYCLAISIGGAVASQSCDWDSSRVAWKAFDMNRDGNWGNGSVSSTCSQATNWWKLDFGAVKTVNRVILYPRTDGFQNQLEGFKVELLGSNGTTVVAGPFNHAARVTAREEIPLSSASARYVKITRTSTGILSVAEVQIE